MADMASAEIFGTMFEMLADEATVRDKIKALRLWELQKAYDFSPYQMECDEALEKLGLATRLLVEERYQEWIYGPVAYIGQ